jgi:hypothetical protein
MFMRSKLIIIFSQFQSGGRHFHHKTKVANNAFLSFDLMKNGNFCFHNFDQEVDTSIMRSKFANNGF